MRLFNGWEIMVDSTSGGLGIKELHVLSGFFHDEK
jgi:hypothetical protein